MTAGLLIIRLGLCATFALAGAAKLADRKGARQAAEDFGLPSRLSPSAAILLPLAELTAAALLLPAASARVGAALAAFLLICFIAGIGAAMARGSPGDCTGGQTCSMGSCVNP